MHRCTAKTEKGKRCGRLASVGMKTCYLHHRSRRGGFGFAFGAVESSRPLPENLLASAGMGWSPTLNLLIYKAGLQDAVAKGSGWTLFAPTEQAFASLFDTFPGVKAYLLDPANRGTLQTILKYHIVPSKIDSTAAVAAAQSSPGMCAMVPTLASNKLAVCFRGGKLTVNGSNVVMKDFMTKNQSVVHVIDGVLVPAAIAAVVQSAFGRK